MNRHNITQGITYKELNERFNNISSKIQFLLSSEAPIEELVSEKKTMVMLGTDSMCHYKISLDGQSPPLKLRLLTQKGISSTFLFISQTNKRPNKDRCDVSYLINKGDFYVFLKGDKGKSFATSWLYLGFESYKEFSGNLIIGFAKKKLTLTEKNESSTSKKTMNIDKLLESPKASRKQALRVRLKAFNKNMFNPKVIEERKIKTTEEKLRIREHRKEVLELKKKYEVEDITRKILYVYKDKVNKLHGLILSEKLREINLAKESTRTWIRLYILVKIARGLYKNHLAVKKQKRNNEKKYFAALRIAVYMKGKFIQVSDTYKERVHRKLIQYFICKKYSGILSIYGQEKRAVFTLTSEKITKFLEKFCELRKVLNTFFSHINSGITFIR